MILENKDRKPATETELGSRRVEGIWVEIREKRASGWGRGVAAYHFDTTEAKDNEI